MAGTPRSGAPSAPGRIRRRPPAVLAPVLATLGFLAAAACGTGPGSSPAAESAATSAATSTGPSSGSSLAVPSAAVTGTPAPSPALATPSGGPLVAGRYQPLWPFADETQVRDWQRSYRAGGHQPWHLDAGQTALAFTQGYLGFKGIDQLVDSTVDGAHARVSVGIRGEGGGRPGIASVIHLVRFGTGGDAPWEVVGTDDTTFSLTTPRYGSSVSSPVKVGGKITGVDESVRVQARGAGGTGPLGERCCVSAGGENRPWSTTLDFRAAPGRTVTIVASTGGHIADVERFAVTGVRTAPR
ncbi:hypothetical protein [Microbispora triticiradicis]|uniref:hypothetical protein n=1 Tax=Microbispora TaxID=2005 RepID=UPI001ABF3969|nr:MULTISPECIES: hypothetical protein [Microbispora]